MTTALIDVDIICYLAAAAAEDEIDWGDGDGPMTTTSKFQARKVAFDTVRKWTEDAGCDRPWLIFSDRTVKNSSFRHRILSTYKGHRAGERPELHDYVKEQLENEFRNRYILGLEGDDVMGILGSGPQLDQYVMVSTDKDMQTVPGHHYNPGKKKKFNIDADQANYFWMYQTLVGDVTDNYKGCPGIGDVKAREILQAADREHIKHPGTSKMHWYWPAVLEAFKAQRKHKTWGSKFPEDMSPFDFALQNARCARILRNGDYDSINQMVTLWHPSPDEIDFLYVGPVTEKEDTDEITIGDS